MALMDRKLSVLLQNTARSGLGMFGKAGGTSNSSRTSWTAPWKKQCKSSEKRVTESAKRRNETKVLALMTSYIQVLA